MHYVVRIMMNITIHEIKQCMHDDDDDDDDDGDDGDEPSIVRWR